MMGYGMEHSEKWSKYRRTHCILDNETAYQAVCGSEVYSDLLLRGVFEHMIGAFLPHGYTFRMEDDIVLEEVVTAVRSGDAAYPGLSMAVEFDEDDVPCLVRARWDFDDIADFLNGRIEILRNYPRKTGPALFRGYVEIDDHGVRLHVDRMACSDYYYYYYDCSRCKYSLKYFEVDLTVTADLTDMFEPTGHERGHGRWIKAPYGMYLDRLYDGVCFSDFGVNGEKAITRNKSGDVAFDPDTYFDLASERGE